MFVLVFLFNVMVWLGTQTDVSTFVIVIVMVSGSASVLMCNSNVFVGMTMKLQP